jgi:hypothetical protein
MQLLLQQLLLMPKATNLPPRDVQHPQQQQQSSTCRVLCAA